MIDTNIAACMAVFFGLLIVSSLKVLPQYLARKILHIGTGMLCIAAQTMGLKWLIIGVGIVAGILIASKKMAMYSMHTYAKEGKSPKIDLGMVNFCAFTVVFAALDIPLVHVSPAYIADPMGAIVGRNVKTAKIWGNKSIGGTAAVFFSAFLSLYFVASATLVDACVWSLAVTAAEAFAGDWDNVAIANMLLARYLMLDLGAEVFLSVAFRILGLDAIGSIITFAFGFFVLGSLIPRSTSAKKRGGNGGKGQDGDSGLDFFPAAAIANENWKRVSPRALVKCGAFFAWLLLVKTHSIGVDPTSVEMLIFHIWFGVMGLLDELNDNIMPLRKARGIANGMAVRCARYGLYAFILLAIPYLIAANDLFFQDAVVIVLNQIIGKKLDTHVFVGTAIIGIPSIGFMGWYSGTMAGWPFTGMIAVVLGHVLYEVHDENPLLVRFNQTFKVPLVVYQLVNQHFIMVVLVGVGLLPARWLLVSSLAYPVAKLGVAYGGM